MEQVLGFIDTLPDNDCNGFTVLLALAWCAGHQVGVCPDEYRDQMRELACAEMNGVVDVLEEKGEAGTARVVQIH